MGYLVTQTYDPEELDIPYDDYDEVDEMYETYQEYDAYMPDMVHDIRPLTKESLDACAKARDAIDSCTEGLTISPASEAVAQLLLYDEAVSTSQAENYPVTCSSMLETRAAMTETSLVGRTPELVAMHAVEALTDFVESDSNRITLDEICLANETFTFDSVRGDRCGEIRERPVWIGPSLFDATYVAPPADTLDDYMTDLLRYVNDKRDGVDPIAKAAIAHVQFITVHPFEDGNGRTGRALAQRLLRQNGVIQTSCLPTTAVLVAQSRSYVDHIQDFRSLRGPANPNDFVRFFANCCEQAAEQTKMTSKKIEGILEKWNQTLPAHDADAKRAAIAFAVCPVMTETMLSAEMGKDSTSAIHTLQDAGVIETGTSRVGNVRIYTARPVLTELTLAQRMHGAPIQASTGLAARLRKEHSVRSELAARTPIAEDPRRADSPSTFDY